MRGTTSVITRLNRMERQQTNRHSEEQIAILADEFDLDPGEVRRELEETARHIRRYGPESEDAQICRLAKEYELNESEIRDEYELILGRFRERGVL